MAEPFQLDEWQLWDEVSPVLAWHYRRNINSFDWVQVSYDDESKEYAVTLNNGNVTTEYMPHEGLALARANKVAELNGGWLSDAPDPVNRPTHYANQGQIECIEVLEQLAGNGEDFRILNAIKYLWRWRHKGGVESLKKAVWYIQRVIDSKEANAETEHS
jgi:hypothetical protein